MRSPLIFRIFKNNQIQFVKQFTDKEQVIIGQQTLTNEHQVDIALEGADIAAIHCLVEKRGEEFYLCDLGSSLGTSKNGQPVVDELLNSGDHIDIGSYRIMFLSVGAKQQVNSSPATQEPEATVAAVVAPVTASVVSPKPVIERPVYKAFDKSTNLFRRKQKNQKTFSSDSAHSDLKQFIKPGKGNSVQVITSWKGRVLDTKTFLGKGMYKAGPGADVILPEGTAPTGWTILDCTSGVQIRLTSDMSAEVNRDQQFHKINEQTYTLQQGEVVYINFINGMQIAIRYVPVGAVVPLDSPYILSSTEVTGILVALIIATLTSLLVSIFAPKPQKVDEEIQRVAQVIFNKPPVELPKPPVVKLPEEKPETKPEVTPKPPEEKKVVIADKEKEQQMKGDKNLPNQKKQDAQKAGAASDLKPKDPKLTKKMFTSTKQGGAVKTGDKSGANAQSKDPDPTNAGLLSAFGAGGARAKLDKAYNGSGELLGVGEKATGASGFNEDRAGSDLGSKFKDTGAGGKGTATQGISGVGTKGRGTGYGSGDGLGSKDQVAVQAGGGEEEFVGSIDKEAVRRAIRSALAAFKACYDREYKKDTKLEGKVTIGWEIHEKGVAQNAQVIRDKTTIGNAIVEECVRSRMLTIRFPEPPTGTVAEVSYPFVFSGQK